LGEGKRLSKNAAEILLALQGISRPNGLIVRCAERKKDDNQRKEGKKEVNSKVELLPLNVLVALRKRGGKRVF